MRRSRRLPFAVLLFGLVGCPGSDSTDPGPVAASITLDVTNLTFSSLGASQQVMAIVLDANGATIAGAPVTWTTGSSAVASVSPTGLVAAVGPGQTMIAATSVTATASAQVTVQQVAASVVPSTTALVLSPPGATATIGASVRDAGGSPIAGASVTWTSDDTSVATVTNTGLVSSFMIGTATLTVEGTAGGSAPVTADVDVTVAYAALQIVSTTLAAGAETQPYSESLAATGGDGSYTWSLASGLLPDGLTLNASGSITGTPTTAGTSTFTVRVMSGDNQTDQRQLSINVSGPVALFTSYLLGGYVGVSYSDAIAPVVGGAGAFSYALTGGALPNGLSLNTSTGAIAGTPGAPGVEFFEITATRSGQTSTAAYSITISAAAESAFNLWVAYEGGPLPTAIAQAGISAAVARWEQVVIGDVPSSTLPSSGLENPSVCALVDATILHSGFIDDVTLVLGFAPIDGVGGTLARAGPCGFFGMQAPVTLMGQVQIDEADLATVTAAHLEDIVWHEIAHAMGLGTLWSSSLTGSGGLMPQYTGVNGNAEWRALGGAFDGVPVEPSIEAHWDEAWFDDEIMTPSTEGPLVPLPISRMTIATLSDIGWTVDLNAADAYSLPGCQPTCMLGAGGVTEPFDEIVVEPGIPLERSGRSAER